MNVKWMLLTGCLMAGLLGQGYAEEAKAPAMTPEEQAKMAEVAKLGAPSEAHKALDPFVGEFSCVVRWKQTPEAPYTESKGHSVNRWILGHRYLFQEFKGDMMGQPFLGLGVSGYDNIRKEYISAWIDNMSTGMMISRGDLDAATRTIRESGEASCPMTGETNKWFRSEWKPVDADHFVFEMYAKDKDGKEFKSMEIAYTRYIAPSANATVSPEAAGNR